MPPYNECDRDDHQTESHRIRMAAQGDLQHDKRIPSVDRRGEGRLSRPAKDLSKGHDDAKVEETEKHLEAGLAQARRHRREEQDLGSRRISRLEIPVVDLLPSCVPKVIQHLGLWGVPVRILTGRLNAA